MYDETKVNYKYADKEEGKGSRKRIENQLINIMQAQIYNLSKYLETSTFPRNEAEVYELIQSQNLDVRLDSWTEQVRSNARQVNIVIASILKFIRQVMYSMDAKKAIQLFTKDQTPQCEVEHELLNNFFDDRWKTGEPISKDLAGAIYKMKETITEEMKKKIMEDLIDFKK
jgi:hypothetical protein